MLSTSVAVRNGGGRAKGRQSVKGKKRVIYIVTVEAIESLAFLYHQLLGINLLFFSLSKIKAMKYIVLTFPLRFRFLNDNPII